MVIFWLLIALSFLLFEMGSPGLFLFLSFFFGGIGAAIVAYFTDYFITQGGAFLMISIGAFFVLRMWINRYEQQVYKTNVYALQGKKAMVITVITMHDTGSVKLDGQVWSARALEGLEIQKGTLVEVVRVSGSHLIVVPFSK